MSKKNSRVLRARNLAFLVREEKGRQDDAEKRNIKRDEKARLLA
jgi:hypothetical protein